VPPRPNLSDRLCALEIHNPLLRERYTQEVQAVLEKKLPFVQKLFLAAVAVASLAIGAFLGGMALVHSELPVLARASLGSGVVFSVAWAYLCGRALRRGTWELRIQPAAMAGLSWGFAVLLETCFLVLAPQFPDHFQATVTLFSGLVILIGAGVMMVAVRIQQAELRTQEALLRLEYRLAEMSENRAKAP
jgi:Na+/proline symporter